MTPCPLCKSTNTTDYESHEPTEQWWRGQANVTTRVFCHDCRQSTTSYDPVTRVGPNDGDVQAMKERGELPWQDGKPPWLADGAKIEHKQTSTHAWLVANADGWNIMNHVGYSPLTVFIAEPDGDTWWTDEQVIENWRPVADIVDPGQLKCRCQGQENDSLVEQAVERNAQAIADDEDEGIRQVIERRYHSPDNHGIRWNEVRPSPKSHRARVEYTYNIETSEAQIRYTLNYLAEISTQEAVAIWNSCCGISVLGDLEACERLINRELQIMRQSATPQTKRKSKKIPQPNTIEVGQWWDHPSGDGVYVCTYVGSDGLGELKQLNGPKTSRSYITPLYANSWKCLGQGFKTCDGWSRPFPEQLEVNQRWRDPADTKTYIVTTANGRYRGDGTLVYRTATLRCGHEHETKTLEELRSWFYLSPGNKPEQPDWLCSGTQIRYRTQGIDDSLYTLIKVRQGWAVYKAGHENDEQYRYGGSGFAYNDEAVVETWKPVEPSKEVEHTEVPKPEQVRQNQQWCYSRPGQAEGLYTVTTEVKNGCVGLDGNHWASASARHMLEHESWHYRGLVKPKNVVTGQRWWLMNPPYSGRHIVGHVNTKNEGLSLVGGPVSATTVSNMLTQQQWLYLGEEYDPS